ncbi:hypothetical protein [Streptomyces mirabilis]|uniref:hypothetical protein n=1 Tax=Streptomyces mirabilis TaxID=68239 RepID=UPI00365F72CB
MLNNQIIITDGNVCARAPRNDKGVVDAAELTNAEWEELRGRNANSTKIKLVQCAKCWELYGEIQWLRTYSTGRGTRVCSHQPGESRPDHDYEPVETPEHQAWNDRAFTIGEAEGYNPRKEAWAADRKTRADVLLTGTLTIAYEHQHSPFSATGRYSAPERTRLAAGVGRTAMWHATSDKVRGQVPILRTDGGLPLKVIANPNYRHEFRGGVYRIEIYTCTVRNGYECPNGKFSGCGKPHARGQVTAGQLDDVLRGAPIGAYMPVVDAKVLRAPRFFWTDMASYGQYLAYIASPAVPTQTNGSPAEGARTRNGGRNGHSRAKEAELEAMRAQAVDLSAPLPGVTSASELVAPSIPRPIPGICDTGRPKCGQPARLYAAGWRCGEHQPSSYWLAR